MSKDKPCILKKRLNGVFDRNIGLIIQRFPRCPVLGGTYHYARWFFVCAKKECVEEAKREIMGWKERRPRGKIGCANGFDSHAGKNIHIEDGIGL